MVSVGWVVIVGVWPFLALALLVRIGHGADLLELARKIFSSRVGLRPDGTTYLLPKKGA